MFVCNWDVRGQRSTTVHDTFEDAVEHAYEVVSHDWGADFPDGMSTEDKYEILSDYLGSRSGDTVTIEEARRP